MVELEDIGTLFTEQGKVQICLRQVVIEWLNNCTNIKAALEGALMSNSVGESRYAKELPEGLLLSNILVIPSVDHDGHISVVTV